MDRRTFITGALAAGALTAMPSVATGEATRRVVWIADGEGWLQAHSLLAVKKGDVFCMIWPIRDKALSDGFIDPISGQDAVYADRFCGDGPKVDPPYPWCHHCKDPRVVPDTEKKDVYQNRAVCDSCVADPGRALRKAEDARKHLRLHPLL